ncbi:hypothetical protein CGGC5_v017209 [Colletotrichum fructicola Nara gc5]|uniref:Ankyrin repeat protein n=1 Tax=Colletotrichum fructicola (strain Nara gc5) TaxID=1213859 RepID=A0A7J6IDG3_COLFN|nr:hypothetical protein CGGC5_v017209 [Colletotrichum fructicola Nara gc5]
MPPPPSLSASMLLSFADWIMNKCHADLELVDSHNKTPLATACEAGQFRLARKLLSLGANPHAASPGTTLAHFALQTCGDMGTRPLARDEGTPETRPLPIDLAKRHHPLLAASGWSANAGQGPMATTSSGALGLVLPAYRALLDATLLGTAFNVGDVWYTDNADRTAFELSHLKTPAKDCKLLIQQWVVSGEENPVLHHLAGPSHRPDLRLSLPVSAISAVLWSARGRPRVILKLRSYDYHNSALRKEVIRVEFRDNVHKSQFLHYMLPLVTTMMEKSPGWIWRVWVEDMA